MPLPVSHSLIGASIIALFYPRISLRRDWLILLFGALLANTPDLDFFLIWGLHLGEEWHRGLTHSIFFALMIACLMLLGTWFSNIRCVLAFSMAFLSHAVLDFLTTKRGGGVELLYPFSSERLKLGVVGISEFDNGFYLTDMIKSGLIELIIFLPIFLAVLLISRYVSESSSIKSNV